jgi:peptidoglycan/LPS O-acetylase OafA/YrhL
MGVIRFALAIIVMTAHTGLEVFLPRGLFNPAQEHWLFNIDGSTAVLYFFVVSGFLMSFVLSGKYRYDPLPFYRSRFLRIYPLWWALFAIVVLFINTNYLRTHQLIAASAFILLGADAVQGFATYPALTDVMPGELGIGWSLAPEVAFYALAPFILRRWWLSASLFVTSAALRYYLFDRFPCCEDQWRNWNMFFFPSSLVYFLAGDLARRLADRFPIDPWRGVVIFLVGVYFANHSQWRNDVFSVIGMGFFALSLPHVFALTKDNRIMNLFGDLTYPLYLTHTIFIRFCLAHYSGFMDRIVSLGPTLGVAAMSIMAIAVAAVCHVVLERPATSLLGAILDRTVNFLYQAKMARSALLRRPT